MSGRRAFVTGATGYVGSRLAGTLVAGGWTVHVPVRPGSDLRRLAPGTIPHLFEGGAAALTDILAEARPDAVFHLAALARLSHDAAVLEAMIGANLLFGTQLLEAMAAVSCPVLIDTGSFASYDRDGGYAPNSLYAATKIAFQDIIAFYVRRHAVRAITLTLFDIYGPGDWRGKFLNLVLDAARTGETLAATPGDQLLELVHVEDVVAGYRRAAALLSQPEAAAGHQGYVLDAGRRQTLRAVVDEMAVVIGRAPPVAWGARAHPPLQIMEPLAAGRRLPGWEARVPLRRGLTALALEAGLIQGRGPSSS